jgi:ribose transport system permease protein
LNEPVTSVTGKRAPVAAPAEGGTRSRHITSRLRSRSLGSIARAAFGRYTILWILAVFVVVVAATNENFATPDNLRSVLRQSSYTGIAAAAMTLLIMSEAFDLSVGSMLGVCAIVTAALVTELGIAGALVGALAVGGGLGAVNGLIVTKLRIPTLVATLGTLYVFLAIGFISTKGKIRGVTDTDFLLLGLQNHLGLPLPFIVMVGVFVGAFVLLRYTSYGRLVRAVGTNERAARFAGVPVARVRLLTFVLVGICVAIAAFLQTAQLSSATPTVGTGYELTVIAIVVLGGTSLSGGRGTLLGTFCGALFFAVLNNTLNLYGVDSYWTYVAVGAVLITALAIDAARDRLLRAPRFSDT